MSSSVRNSAVGKLASTLRSAALTPGAAASGGSLVRTTSSTEPEPICDTGKYISELPDCSPRRIIRDQSLLANRIPARPNDARQRFIDQNRPLAAGRIVVREIAARAQRNLHGLDISRV